jgi:hypothetical protein
MEPRNKSQEPRWMLKIEMANKNKMKNNLDS